MRVLIVEDSVALSEAMAELLKSRDLSAEVVHTVADAQDFVSHETFDLVILDLNLPGASGEQLLAYLQSKRNAVPVFVVSARADLADRVTLLDAGADDYLVKPFDPAEFLARVSALLRRPKQRQLSKVSFERLEFNFDTRQSTSLATGATLHLTPRERTLLAALMRNPGQIVAKEVLTNLLYSLTSGVSPSAVEVYISRLRSKLQEGDTGVLIRSVRSSGYRLSGPQSGAKA